jgi:hypothetical protein
MAPLTREFVQNRKLLRLYRGLSKVLHELLLVRREVVVSYCLNAGHFLTDGLCWREYVLILLNRRFCC